MVTALHPSTDFARFRYHTGGQPTHLAPGERCPPLFRDVGFEAMARFLRGTLRRLCGPLSPITYLRTADYVEPYTDHGQIGRVMLLQPQGIAPWHAGIETVYIAPRETPVDMETMVFVPTEIAVADAACRLEDVRHVQEVADVIGARFYEEAQRETLARLDQLRQTHAETEQWAGPLRRRFQSHDEWEREQAREWMLRVGMTEGDLCTAWHHLPKERREQVRAALRELPEALTC